MDTVEQVALSVLEKEAGLGDAVKKMFARMKQMKDHVSAKSTPPVNYSPQPRGLLDGEKKKMIQRQLRELDDRMNRLAPIAKPHPQPQYPVPVIEPKMASAGDLAKRVISKTLSAEGKTLAKKELGLAGKGMIDNVAMRSIKGTEE